jgi:hypothetical protein
VASQGEWDAGLDDFFPQSDCPPLPPFLGAFPDTYEKLSFRKGTWSFVTIEGHGLISDIVCGDIRRLCVDNKTATPTAFRTVMSVKATRLNNRRSVSFRHHVWSGNHYVVRAASQENVRKLSHFCQPA